MILSGENVLLGTVAQDPYTQGYKAVEALVQSLNNESSATEGKMTIVPGTYLGVSDLEAVKAWRKANGLK
jgi:ABC-type sugar transport system substrate-binding protein